MQLCLVWLRITYGKKRAKGEKEMIWLLQIGIGLGV